MTTKNILRDILHQLPPSPVNKSSWPWTNVSKPFPSTMPDSKPWPKISIITPSYNQGRFIEETIRSVLLQNYPNLEYIIMDGGSTDNSIEIIKKYEPWLTYWVSEKDSGQADAIYRGFEKASGEIIAWINSDDYYLPDSLMQTALSWASNSHAEIIIGGIYYINENGEQKGQIKSFPQDFESLLCFGQYLAQPGSFWLRKVFFEVGGFDRCLRFAFDYDLFLRLSKKYKFHKLDKYLAVYRDHSKTKANTIWNEVGKKEAKMVQQNHGIANIDRKKKTKIIKKENLRFLYIQCKSHRNILFKFWLSIALILKSLKYTLNL